MRIFKEMFYYYLYILILSKIIYRNEYVSMDIAYDLWHQIITHFTYKSF